ncbi:unnamed protein product [Eruca vesicaria subsp. sativa]|uniref:Uncharacterized protein n=1 Tax=Eruca vesicaria subsp. sativa TaxID=29727 RepID=A0ABC8K7T5_ERUVS|nr:unnamed protein product [Eruca vesicaria subsp. sativa]
MRDFKSRVKSNTLAHKDLVFYQDANVDIKWDMTNESDGSYSANVTISNYVMDHQIEQPWKLAFIWVKRETLLSTLGYEGTQHGFVSFGKGDDDTYCLNNVTFVDLPRQSTDHNCIGGTVIFPRVTKADLAKSSTSFQVSVSHSNRGYRGFEYESECDSMEQEIDVHLNTWRTTCILSIAKANKFHEIHEDL